MFPGIQPDIGIIYFFILTTASPGIFPLENHQRIITGLQGLESGAAILQGIFITIQGDTDIVVAGAGNGEIALGLLGQQ